MKVLVIEKEAVIHVVVASLTKKLFEPEQMEVNCEIRISYVIVSF